MPLVIVSSITKIKKLCICLCTGQNPVLHSHTGLWLCIWGKIWESVYICCYQAILFYLFFRLFETLQSLFWSIFGLINLYVTNVKAQHEFTEFVGATMFGTYNVISLVVLLNMLIAMMNNSYQLIAVSYISHCLIICNKHFLSILTSCFSGNKFNLNIEYIHRFFHMFHHTTLKDKQTGKQLILPQNNFLRILNSEELALRCKFCSWV